MRAWFVLLAPLGLPATVWAQSGDPCDFASVPLVERQQVLECYRSVPFDEDDKLNQLDVFRRFLEFSDLRNTYDAQVNWRRQLRSIERRTFRNDFEMVQAFRSVALSFRNGHFVYQGPACYNQILFPFIPLTFGSQVASRSGRDRQIIFVDGTVLSNDYLQATGIDASAFIGQEVVRIEGRAPLAFFRRFGRRELQFDANDGVNLNAVLQFNTLFSARLGAFQSFPRQERLRVTLRDDAGRESRLELPWVFVEAARFGLSPIPATSSTEEFAAVCATPNPAALARGPSGAASSSPSLPTYVEPRLEDFRLRQLKEMHERLSGTPNASFRTQAVPEEDGIREIIPLNNEARVVEFEGRTTAIQLRGSFLPDWREEVRQGAAFACENSENLIIDVRSNTGGFISLTEWLARYLQPQTNQTQDFSFIFRELSREPTITELRELANLAQAQGIIPPVCASGFEPQCFGALEDRQPFTDPDWFQSPTIRERRGRRSEVVTRLLAFPEGLSSIEPDETIPCPGRFEGDNLIIVVDGLNASAGFFFAEWVRDVSTIVSLGGVLGQPLTSGIARGGTVTPVASIAEIQTILGQLTGVNPTRAFPLFNRNVSLTIERLGAYDENFVDLFADSAPVANVQLPLWTNNTPETDGTVYRAVLSALESR